jgi:hypothetical protein
VLAFFATTAPSIVGHGLSAGGPEGGEQTNQRSVEGTVVEMAGCVEEAREGATTGYLLAVERHRIFNGSGLGTGNSLPRIAAFLRCCS